MRKQLISLRRQ